MVNEYMSAEQAAAESPYASAPSEGSPSWYSAEIASREAEAAANTISSPSGDSGMAGEGFYTDPRTGEAYANYTQFLAQNPAGVSVPVWSTPGVPVTTPTGETFYTRYSQYWMDPEYTGTEPTLNEKAYYSDAEYAAAFAGTLMEQYDQQTISPAARRVATIYPKLTANPVPQRVAGQADQPDAATELLNQASDVINTGANWITNNLLIVVIVIAGLIVLPRVIPSASRGR